jgi:UPF0176 protein
MRYLNLAFYKFVDLDALAERRKFFREISAGLGLRGTILLSDEGINAFVAGEETSARRFIEKLCALPEFADLEPKESWSDTLPFGRMLVKLKKEIIPFGQPEIRPQNFTAKRLKPSVLKQWLDEGRDVVLLDTRNRYEIEHGTFLNASDFGLGTFRQFPEKLKDKARELKDKTVVMFCTGGIRCEKAGAYAVAQGFESVFQLDGGILKYFEECGGAHYDGDCFVFDERVALSPELKASQKTPAHPDRSVALAAVDPRSDQDAG